MPKSKSSEDKSDAGTTPSFEASLEEVEHIVDQLESGELGLSESLERYEIGIKRLKQCHRLLEDAEQKVLLLSGLDKDGNARVAPLDISSTKASDGNSEGDRPRKRRSRKVKPSSDVESDDELDDLPGLF